MKKWSIDFEIDFKKVVNHFPEIMFVSDPFGESQFFNKKWYEYTGLTEDQVGMETWIKAIHPEDLTIIGDTWAKALEANVIWKAQYRIRRHDGVYRWVEGQSAPEFDSTGKIIRRIGMVREIHDEKMAAQDLEKNKARLNFTTEKMKENEEKLRIALTSMKMGTWHIDLKTRVATISQRMAEIFGLDEAMSGNIYDAVFSSVHPEDRNAARTALTKAVENRTQHFNQYRIIAPDGSIRWVQTKGHCTYTAEGVPIALVGLLWDITESKTREADSKNFIEKENFLNLYKQSSQFVFTLTGKDLNFDFVNATYAQFLGFNPTGSSFAKVQPDSTELRKIFTEVLKTGKTVELNDHPIFVLGKPYYLNLTIVAARNGQGQPSGVMVMGSDVSEQIYFSRALETRKKCFERSLKNESIGQIFSGFVELVESQGGPDFMASILLMEPEGRRLLHGTTSSQLPKDYVEAVHGLKIGGHPEACGSAEYFSKTVSVIDIENDWRWENYRDVALSFNIKACWSTPILSSEGKVLGVFVVYSKKVGEPAFLNPQTVELITNTAAIIIERQNIQEELSKTIHEFLKEQREKSSNLSTRSQ